MELSSSSKPIWPASTPPGQSLQSMPKTHILLEHGHAYQLASGSKIGSDSRLSLRLGAHPHVDHHVGVFMFQIVAMEHVSLVASEIVGKVHG